MVKGQKPVEWVAYASPKMIEAARERGELDAILSGKPPEVQPSKLLITAR